PPPPRGAHAGGVYSGATMLAHLLHWACAERGDDLMRWLTAILALLLLGLVAFPAVESGGAWLAHRSDHVQSINYLPREIHELSASGRRATHRDLGRAD